MTTSNQSLAKRVIDEVINAQNLSVIDEILTNDFLYIDATLGTFKGRDVFKDVMVRFFVAFTDLVWTVEQEVSEGETIVSRYSWTATNAGEYRDRPATHKKVTANGVSINRFSNGKLAETRMLRDDLGLMRQLGVIPEQPDSQ